MRKNACLLCAVTLPATGADKTDNLPIGITENRHMSRLIRVFPSFDYFFLPLKKSGEVEQRDLHICTRVVVTYILKRTVTEYIYLRKVLKYNFEGSVLYLNIIFGEYS